MIIKNKTLFILMIVFTILSLCDIVTTIFIIEGEANPIINLVGNMWFPFLLKILIIYIMWSVALHNVYPSNFYYYAFIAIIIFGSLVTAIAQYSNISAILNPEILQAAAATSVAERTSGYLSFMIILYLLPILLSMLIFWVYERSHKKAIIDKEIAKKDKWFKWSIKR